MLKQHAPELLQLSCAATLVRASAPILVQEISRLVRHLHDSTIGQRRRLAEKSGGRGWLNFNFVREGTALLEIAKDLNSEMWDVKAIEKAIGALADPNSNELAHPMCDQLMKIYTVDLAMRGSARNSLSEAPDKLVNA
jgi:hypothetical protein